MTKLRTLSITREPIECFSKVLDGTPVARGLGISKRLDVMFKVSFNIAIMSLMLKFKSWKQNNNVLTNFCTISCIWSWDTWKFHLNLLSSIVYLCVCISFWLISFYLLTDFSLFVQWSLLWIYTFTTPNVMTLHVMTNWYQKISSI
jgi:hypothetical protein